jgi:hypothetical protein
MVRRVGELADAAMVRPGMDEDDGAERLSPEERARLVIELAEGTGKWVGWDAAREACERVNQTAQETR